MSEVFLTREEIEHPYANLAVMLEDKRKKAEQMRRTVFDRITQSPEVLAEKLVYWRIDQCGDFFYSSSVLGNIYENRQEAIAATVEKLKEVAE